ncbi:MAG: hypothetical protein FWD71_22090, partial [Oscillospiraceae bacterium]|nr:hypothetical protein [Oscillospiraceae bacterium]
MEQKKTKIFFILGSHMDLFWMGTTRDCLDRGCDIINRAIELCDKYQEYCFYIETVIFAEYFLKYHPDKHDRFMELVREGRFEIGCSYVDRYEHYYGGESIARHHILANRWLKSHGITSISTCHPDLPGMSPQIPQICAEAGIKYYIRARGPIGIFDWTAPDGTRLIYCSVFQYGKINADTVGKAIETIEGAHIKLPFYVLRGGYSDLEMPDDEIIGKVREIAEQFPEYDFAISSP